MVFSRRPSTAKRTENSAAVGYSTLRTRSVIDLNTNTLTAIQSYLVQPTGCITRTSAWIGYWGFFLDLDADDYASAGIQIVLLP